MRLREIDRGDGIANRLLIGFISLVARMRLPDAARVALYHKDFFGVPMGAWTQATMRGPGPWSVGERELMAAMVAKWNAAMCSSSPTAAPPTTLTCRTPRPKLVEAAHLVSAWTVMPRWSTQVATILGCLR